GLFLCKR
nr:immunoglobulin heavy chain junction region [Mus musculus]